VRLPERALRFLPFDDFPDWRELSHDRMLSGRRRDVVDAALEKYADRRPRAPLPHQVLGACHSIQDDAVVEALIEEQGLKPPLSKARRSQLEREAASWVVLLQLEAEGDWRFASDGRLFLVVPREDLARGNLERARVVLQR